MALKRFTRQTFSNFRINSTGVPNPFIVPPTVEYLVVAGGGSGAYSYGGGGGAGGFLGLSSASYNSGYVGSFNGSNQYLTIPYSTPVNTALDFGTGDFTVEFWMYCVTDWNNMSNPGVIGKKTND